MPTAPTNKHSRCICSKIMSEHHGAVFNNSCLKVPRNPSSKKPYPIYDQKLINQLENQVRKLSIESCNANKASAKDTLKSFIEFYDSIPEYDDVNHLSNKEFYRKLENLKEKQRSYFEYLQHELKFENRKTGWIEEYKNLNYKKGKNLDVESTSSSSEKDAGKKSPPTRKVKKFYKVNKNEDLDYICSSEKDVLKPGVRRVKQFYDKAEQNNTELIFTLEKEPDHKPPSRRSVRIESPPEKYTNENSPDFEYFRSKSRADVSSAGSKIMKTASPINDSIFDDFSDLDVDKDETLTTKSAPSSPRKPTVGWKDCGITIPKPFQMTVRDEENKIVEELIIKNKKSDKNQQHQMFRANPVPIESQIPIFDKVMYDQERRRQIVKKKSKDSLRAQMRPFSFTKRDEEIQAITKRLSKSSPSLFFFEEKPPKVKKFKAKPVPKNLFSNYIYRKMHEDEFYRALQRKIRSEEMLKAASLPPAMAKRELYKPKFHVCPRSFRDVESANGSYRLKTSANKEKYSNLEKELAELELDFILSTPSPKPVKSKKKKCKKNERKSSAETKNSRCQSALESVNRSNLAAVLRIETARKRMEDEISRRLEQAHIREEARWKEKILRKKPVWQTLTFSHEEDLNMRLQLRRDEERLRKEEHKLRMQTMLGRVQQRPTLFERQSQARFAKSREELITKLYKNTGRYSSSSKMSYSDNSDRRSVVEMKDEAIQAHFDEIFKDEEQAAIHDEDNDDVKSED